MENNIFYLFSALIFVIFFGAIYDFVKFSLYYSGENSFPQFSTETVEKAVENTFFVNLSVDFQTAFSTLHTFWANDYAIF